MDDFQPSGSEYVDTRGPWPTYVWGVLAVSLPGKPRDISVPDARAVASKIIGQSL